MARKRKATQKDKVLQHLREVGPIDVETARESYGVQRLAPVIHNLRGEGHDISRDRDRYGDTIYRLEGGAATAQDRVLAPQRPGRQPEGKHSPQVETFARMYETMKAEGHTSTKVYTPLGVPVVVDIRDPYRAAKKAARILSGGQG
jgi:hypothetical protein